MARINIEDSLFNDGRFKAFCSGKDEATAIGQMVILWKLAQTYWLDGMRKIPVAVFKTLNFHEELIKCDLVLLENDEIYVRGSEKQFNWWFSCAKNGKKGGRPRKKVQKIESNKPDENPSVTDTKPTLNQSRTSVEPSLLFTPYSLLSTPTNNIQSITPDDIFKLWNSSCSLYKLPSVIKLNKSRISLLKASLKDFPDITSWEIAFEQVGLLNERLIASGKAGWLPDFDYAIRLSNTTKMIEQYQRDVKHGV